MQSFYVKIVAISVIVQSLILTIANYEPLTPLRKILGLYCDGFSCLGTGIVIAFIMLAVLPIIVLIIGYFLAKERKIVSALQAFGIAILIALVFVAMRGIFNGLEIKNNILEAELSEQQFQYEITQRTDAVEEKAVRQENALREVTEITKAVIVDKKLGSEFVATGVVINHNLEDVEMLGGYIQVKLDVNKRDVFVIYNPYMGGKKAECLHNIVTDAVVGDAVEIRGITILEINSTKPKNTLISTCENPSYYIKKI
ncbi:MAG: hypothetical protein RL097_639 [Candidatus Parcubacteria bacterium]|jgi:hypothetical protein